MLNLNKGCSLKTPTQANNLLSHGVPLRRLRFLENKFRAKMKGSHSVTTFFLIKGVIFKSLQSKNKILGSEVMVLFQLSGAVTLMTLEPKLVLP